MKKTLFSFLIVLGTIKIFGQNQCPDAIIVQDYNIDEASLPIIEFIPPYMFPDVILSLEEYNDDPGNKYLLMEWHDNLKDSTWFTDYSIINFDSTYVNDLELFADWNLYKEDPVISFKANNSGKSNISLRFKYDTRSGCVWGTEDYWSDVIATDEWDYYSFRLKDMNWKIWSGSTEMTFDLVPTTIQIGIHSINPSADVDYDINFKIDDWKVSKYGCDFVNIRNDQRENIKSHSVKIYPKPASDYLRITSFSEISEIEIIDISGRSMSQTFHNSKEIELDVSQYKAGIYFIKVRMNSETYTEKVFVSQ